MTLAPILLFVYNRPLHVRRSIESLLANELAKESELYIFSDAAKDEMAQPNVNEVRQFIHSIKGFKEIHYVERTENWGLARNIIDGVTTLVNQYGRVIVLEDDLIVAPYFESNKICELNSANFQGINEIQKHSKNYKGIKKPLFYSEPNKNNSNKENIIIPLKYLNKIKMRYPKIKYKENKTKKIFVVESFE